MTTTNGNGQKPAMGIRELLLNHTLLSRQEEIFRNLFDPRRSLEAECGHPDHDPDAHYYHALFRRDPIAARVVEVFPKSSWQIQPLVYESDDPEEVTAFEESWDALGHTLRGENSYYLEEAGSCIWEYLLRADTLSGIGHYGVILLGLDDGLSLDRPAAPRKGQKLLYLRVFPESLADIVELDADESSPRFGQPIYYNITLNDPRNQHGGTGLSTATKKVHWTRVIHLADNLNSSEVFGEPRLQRPLNRVLDLRKVYGADAEAYWKNCLMKLFFETHPALGGDVQVDQGDLKDMMEEFANGMQGWAALMGMSAKTVAPAVVDPTAHINVQIEAICIALDIPKRKFMGSERGELASSQDDGDWNDVLRARQGNYITPRIIVPFTDRLIWLQVLASPKKKSGGRVTVVSTNAEGEKVYKSRDLAGGYSIWWPDLTSQTEAEKADIAVKKTDALAKYVGGGVEAVIPPIDYLTGFMGMTDEEANQVLENAAALMEEKAEEEMALEEERAAIAAEERAKLEAEQPAAGEGNLDLGERGPEPAANAQEPLFDLLEANTWTPIADAFVAREVG